MFSSTETDQEIGGKRLAKRRRDAAERAVAMGLPSFTEEVWRYSPIDELDLERYEIARPKSEPLSASAAHTPAHADSIGSGSFVEGPFMEGIAPAALVSITNGVIDAVAVHALGVTICTLRKNYELVGDQPGKAATGALLGSVMNPAVDFFAEANLAFTTEPIVVKIAPGLTLDDPIVISARTDIEGICWFPRVVVVAEAGSKAVVVELHTSSEVECLVCPVTELQLAEEAQLSYVTVQQMGSKAWQIASQASLLAADARLTTQHVALGGGYARARIDTSLMGERSHSELAAAYFGNGDTDLDFRTYQRHVAPNTTSELLFKGALDDSSKAVYTGLIRIEPTASGVEAFQTNRNLKLSPNAWAQSVPNLEIENNDVKCSHASATGPVDPDQRFYLERLGVPSDAAELLVVQGFFDEVIDTLPVKQIGVAAGEHIAALLAGRLPGQLPGQPGTS